MSEPHTRILPEFVEVELKRLPWRALGGALMAASAAGYASLLTWSATDPSFNLSSGKTPQNALGYFGASYADVLMQSFGLAAPALLLPLVVWGFGIARGIAPHPAGRRLVQWLCGAVLIGGALSMASAPKGWPLAHGLGGFAGDFASGYFLRFGGFIEPTLAAFIGAALAAASGAWLLLRSMELFVKDLHGAPTLAGQESEPAAASASGWREALTSRATSWTARFALRKERSLVAPVITPTEYWLRGVSVGSLVQAAHGMKDRLVTAVAREAETSDAASEAPRVQRLEPHFGPLAPDADGGEDDGWDGSRSLAPYRAYDADEETVVAQPFNAASDFTLPPLSLLKEPPRKKADTLPDDELLRRAQALETVLDDFGVKGKITRVHPGPVITLYELEPARGTKSSRVIGLADDIARSMSAVSARVSVIPGRDALGIELPNDVRETVHLRDLLGSPQFRDDQARLALALGKTIAGQPLIADLARMPHLLIAGTTGSGKSVGINAMILSLLYRLTPAEARFIMIDPKMLELSVYDGIPHLLAPVVTDPKKAIAALKWTVNEMNGRYEKMSKLGVRNISGYNQKVAHAQLRQTPLRRTVNTGFDELTGAPVYESEDIAHEPMPYIVVVIDEMADLMMAAGKEIEYCVMRLAQMARAAGIHVIMATQRPSVDVITGTIKANFPSRISYQVTSKIDSRTILGEQGAEQLLGAGDMLYMASGGRISRAHGPFVSDSDLERVVGFLKSQGEPEYSDAVTKALDADEDGGESAAKADSGDDLYDEAVSIVLADQRPTTSYLQRRLGIGYNRAASLIERMEEDGIVSAPNRTGKRDVLAPGAH
jgi:S-DNA-T family DNA segregation ATPase FtsK/SpoIIIE